MSDPVAYIHKGEFKSAGTFPRPWRDDPARYGLTPLYAEPPNRDGVLEEAAVTDEMLERALRAYFPGYEWSLHKAMGDDVQRVVAAHMRAALTAALKTQDQEHGGSALGDIQ